jgi:septal ring factor EnvC (AmiA/AmiB activator)
MSRIFALFSLYRLYVELALVAAIAGGAVYAVHHYGNKREAAGMAKVQALWDHEKAAQQAVAIKAQAANAAETERRLKEQHDAEQAHETQLAQARAESAAAADAVSRLRASIAAISARSRSAASNPAVAAVSAPADRLGAVAAESVAEYSALAEVARRGQLAGIECAADYDAVQKRKP